MIVGREEFTVVAGLTFMVHLLGQCHAVRFVTETLFFASRMNHDPARAVEAHMHVIDDHRAAVNVVEAHAHIEHGAIVEERPASPLAAFEAYATVSEAVIDAAVKADVRSPVATVPAVAAMLKAPVARRPQHAYRRDNPRSRDPVVAAIFIPSPITGGP